MDLEKLTEVLKSPSDVSNNDLEKSLGFLSNNFDETKSKIIKLTKILDFTENQYNKLLREYKNRNL